MLGKPIFNQTSKTVFEWKQMIYLLHLFSLSLPFSHVINNSQMKITENNFKFDLIYIQSYIQTNQEENLSKT